MPELKVVDNATCTFCGCVCDDMELTVEDNHITKANNACVLGKTWFLNHHIEERPVATIKGQPVSLEEAVERAAEILVNAYYPIVYGLSDTTCEAQRVAVAIADRVGACVDTTTSVCHGPSGMAFQGVGEVTCTLGEVKNRAHLVIFWGSNPAESPGQAAQGLRGAVGAAGAGQGRGVGPGHRGGDGHPPGEAAGPRRAHEEVQVRHPLLRHGVVHDARQAPQRRGRPRPGP